MDFKLDFWISRWISGFQIGFLDFVWISRFLVGFLDFALDFGFLVGFLPTVYEISGVSDPSLVLYNRVYNGRGGAAARAGVREGL